MRVVSSHSGEPATWGHMAIRQILIPITLTLPFSFLAAAFGAASSDYGAALPAASIVMNFLSWTVFALDAFWIFSKGAARRITDLWAKTDVLNMAVTLPSPNQNFSQSQTLGDH